MNKTKKSKLGLYILYGAVTVLFLLAILSFNDIGSIMEELKNADVKYILLSFASILVYIALYPLSLCILTKARGCDIKMTKTYGIAMTEHFFNGITPFATGGQPFQAYAFAKAKVKPTEFTCLLLMNFMVFMLVTNGFALCALFYFEKFVSDGAMAAIAVIGFSMNFIVLGVTFLVATSHKVSAFLSRLVDFFCRFKWIARFLEPKKESLKEYFVNVQVAFAELKKKKGAFFLAVFTKILSMAAYYLTTFFILLALRVPVVANDIFFVICGTSFAVTMVVFLPTPGSSGGIEFAFKTVFASIAAGAAASVSYGGMLIWRLLSYYFVMLISLIFYIILEIRLSRNNQLKAEESDGLTKEE
ncbi:MAG: flippase-like domain-containing protein [Clostridia bacterium]|nr:flippase-like domain-containing protein [Clostridia bacterium]